MRVVEHLVVGDRLSDVEIDLVRGELLRIGNLPIEPRRHRLQAFAARADFRSASVEIIKARIESSPGVKLALVGEGDICGEMSFLEGTIASASVIADTDVEVLAIQWTKLQQLFDLYPHLGSRFYRSLALNLSRRLRRQLSFTRQ